MNRCLTLFVLIPMVSGSASGAVDDRFARVAEQLVAAIHADDQRQIQAMFTPTMQKALPEQKAREFFAGLLRARGKITAVGKPAVAGSTATVRLTCERGAWTVQLTLNAEDKIAGLYFREPGPDVPVPPRNSVPLRLPFDEEWSVFWGGETEQQNQHVGARNQRRAIDLVIRDAQGKSFSTNGKRNEDYYCYGKPILAPAGGTVVTVIDGVPDNAPGSMNPYSALGNCVILRHAEHEYAVLAHFEPHSILVKEGDAVKAGQPLGRCGNSGNSSEPHLHFHLQNTAVIQDGTGFPAFFRYVRLTRDGKTTVEKECAPVRGDRVLQQTP